MTVATESRLLCACDAVDPRGTDTTALAADAQVAFTQGEYDSVSPEGQHTITHELTHGRQQTGGAVSNRKPFRQILTRTRRGGVQPGYHGCPGG